MQRCQGAHLQPRIGGHPLEAILVLRPSSPINPTAADPKPQNPTRGTQIEEQHQEHKTQPASGHPTHVIHGCVAVGRVVVDLGHQVGEGAGDNFGDGLDQATASHRCELIRGGAGGVKEMSVLDPNAARLVQKPRDKMHPTGRASSGYHAAAKTLTDRRAHALVEQLGVVIAGDKDDVVAGFEKPDQRVFDPRIGIKGRVQPVDRQRLALARVFARKLDVPEVDEVAVDDQLPRP